MARSPVVFYGKHTRIFAEKQAVFPLFGNFLHSECHTVGTLRKKSYQFIRQIPIFYLIENILSLIKKIEFLEKIT